MNADLESSPVRVGKRSRGGDRRLDVWLYGQRIAVLTEPSRYRYQLAFTEEALDSFGEGSRMLSLSLPVSSRAIRDRTDPSDIRVSAFLEGLLPEGNLRRHIATTVGVLQTDKMALLAKVGAECAGAVQFVAAGASPTGGSVRELSRGEVDRLIADLPTYHLPAGSTPQASLAGIQDKVLLTALPGNRWGWPEQGALSTHIVKPEPLGTGALPHLIEAENWSLRVARAAGLAACTSHVESFDGRSAIVVQRYDRVGASDADSNVQTGKIERVHQEDFCQALGLDPGAKYESTEEPGGSRLRRIVRLAADRSVDPEQLRIDLLSAVTFNVITGNGDAHSKNYSLLIGRRGQVSLAPLYDTAPVMYLNPRFRSTGHVINGRTNIDWVDIDDLAAEAAQWGMTKTTATRTVTEVMERVHESAAVTALPPQVDALVRTRLDALWKRRAWAVPATSPMPTAVSHGATAVPDETSSATSGRVFVHGYINRSGTQVPEHWRSRPTR